MRSFPAVFSPASPGPLGRVFPQRPAFARYPAGLYLAAIAALAFASCASAPKTAPGVAEDFALLDGGGRLYFFADMAAARPLLDLPEFRDLSGGAFSAGESAEILAMVHYAAGGIYGNGTRRFHIAARGRFPAARAHFGLGLSSGWKKVKSASGPKYWRAGNGTLSFHLDSRLVIISDADPFLVGSPVELPVSLHGMAADAAISGWIPEPRMALASLLAGAGIPLQIPADTLVFGLYPVPAPAASAPPETAAYWYRAVLRLETPQARHLTYALNTARRLLTSGAQNPEGSAALIMALLANPPEQEDNALILKSAPLPLETIALLFRMISVY